MSEKRNSRFSNVKFRKISQEDLRIKLEKAKLSREQEDIYIKRFLKQSKFAMWIRIVATNFVFPNVADERVEIPVTKQTIFWRRLNMIVKFALVWLMMVPVFSPGAVAADNANLFYVIVSALDKKYIWFPLTAAAIFTLDYLAKFIASPIIYQDFSWRSYWKYSISFKGFLSLLELAGYWILPYRSLMPGDHNTWPYLFIAIGFLWIIEAFMRFDGFKIVVNGFKRNINLLIEIILFGFLLAFLLAILWMLFDPRALENINNMEGKDPTIWHALYFTIVVATSIGFGDATPTNGAGQFLTVLTVIMGVSIIATLTTILIQGIMGEMKAEKERKKSMVKINEFRKELKNRPYRRSSIGKFVSEIKDNEESIEAMVIDFKKNAEVLRAEEAIEEKITVATKVGGSKKKNLDSDKEEKKLEKEKKALEKKKAEVEGVKESAEKAKAKEEKKLEKDPNEAPKDSITKIIEERETKAKEEKIEKEAEKFIEEVEEAVAEETGQDVDKDGTSENIIDEVEKTLDDESSKDNKDEDKK